MNELQNQKTQNRTRVIEKRSKKGRIEDIRTVTENREDDKADKDVFVHNEKRNRMKKNEKKETKKKEEKMFPRRDSNPGQRCERPLS